MARITTSIAALLLALSLTPLTVTSQTQQGRAATGTAAVDASRSSGAVKKPFSAEDIEADMAEALAIIESSHVDGKKLDYNDLFKTSIDSMLSSLDPHSNYLDAKEFEQFRTDQSSRYFGIGATIGDLTDENGKLVGTYIKATFDGAPAFRAGLRYGDKILEVNGVSMVGKPFAEVRNNLRGPRGTTAKIVIERHGTGQRETIDIVRDAVPQPSIAEYYMIRPQVGYIAMTGGFNQTTFTEFRQAMQSLKSKGMSHLVLDLRNNGGGLVNQAFFVANTFLQKGQTIFTQKGRIEGAADTYRSNNSAPETTPVVVLVNRNTASASEILAGALQDHDRALIVGESTFGKGLVQNPFPLEYGSMLLLTIAKYETPSGRLIQRDYSDGNLYNYFTKGGTLREENQTKPAGEEKKTDAGRPVFSGGGIEPDETIKARTLTDEEIKNQVRLVNPVFAFALDLVAGKIPGFENYSVKTGIKFDYDITPKDFEITPMLIAAFGKFAADRYKVPVATVDKEKEFVERSLRTELVTAAYGSTTSFQVFNEYDNQLLKALDLLPKAKAMAGLQRGAAPSGSLQNR